MKVTLTELTAFVLLLAVPIATTAQVGKSLGLWAGLGAGLVSFSLASVLTSLWYRVLGRRTDRRRLRFREQYRSIYRVLVVPADPQNVLKPDGAELRAGDYGWEAEPIRSNGLIYLHGLDPSWRVVWWAGFTPDQVERVAEKPCSQYDWDPAHPRPVCPFPVQERSTTAMGLPT